MFLYRSEVQKLGELCLEVKLLVQSGGEKKSERKPDQDFNIFQQAYQELKPLWLKL